MVSVEDIESAARNSPKNVRFDEAMKLATSFFGEPRNKGGSHYFFKVPWSDDPRVNLQNDHGFAKVYQVRQLLAAIDRLNGVKEEDDDGNG